MYDDAQYAVNKSLALDKTYQDAIRESKVIDSLKNERMNQRIAHYENMVVRTVYTKDREYYNILSIDGGGIRGILPAVWLSEIERKTHRSIASMFQMVAGTSTGAIIAAGLTIPQQHPMSVEPLYKAADLVKLYTTKASEIFSRSNTLGSYIKTDPRYTDRGRKTLFSTYFRNTRISEVLTDLVIPAVTAENPCTHLFTKCAAVADSSKNHMLQEVLMCTTAAPTYFSPYKLGTTVYTDGGVHLNQPSLAACNEAIRTGRSSQERIFLLSLGTGSFVRDPLNPNATRNLWFYLTHRETVLQVILDGPQNNIDSQCTGIIGENYHRWQVWFEESIKLDDTNPKTIEFLFDTARAHIEEMEGYDNKYRLGLLIDHLKES
ncbi:unnamed protein product [Didymodactylos carnosus]|uniref:PNPLA domain-containing protein n=3 Tax=Didymodactylos carnosus TaxID=1234261 RepID=A0A816D3C6_9BILA|nr:unnamed protein product [Didymodactylos carnosus]CAF4526762.1 unnamed protein product [Didymodactylos carnosus]